MTSFRIRPRFQHVSKKSMEAIQEKIKHSLEQPEANCIGRVIPGHVVLKIPAEDQHYWSPQLSLSLEELEAPEEGVLLRGLYGPNPNVWAMFAFGYAALGFMSLFVSIIGFSRMNLGLAAPILWFLPFFAVGFLALYVIAQIGQKIGVAQTFTLHHFFEEAIDEKIGIG